MKRQAKAGIANSGEQYASRPEPTVRAAKHAAASAGSCKPRPSRPQAFSKPCLPWGLMLAGLSVAYAPIAWGQSGGFGGVRVQGIVITTDPAPAPNIQRSVLVRDSVTRIAPVRQSPAQGLNSPTIAKIERAVATPSVTRRPPATATGTGPTTAAGDRILYSDPTLFSNARICGALYEPTVRNQLNEKLKDALITQIRLRLPGGFSTHSQTNHQLGSECSTRTEIVGNRLTLYLTIPRNRFFARITTPDGFPGDLDPNFWTHYDLEARATFHLPTSVNSQVRQESLRIGAVNIDRPETRSFTGNLVLTANSIITDIFGGPDFVAKLQTDQYVSLSSMVSVDLARWNQELRSAQLPADTRIDNSFNGDLLVMHLTRRQPTVPNLH